MAPELSSQFKLKCKDQLALINIPTSALNYTQLAQTANVSREAAEKIYLKYVSCFGKAVMENKNLLVTLHRVAEISVVNGTLTYHFMPDFVANFSIPGGKGGSATAAAASSSSKNMTLAAQKVRALKLLQNATPGGGGSGQNQAPTNAVAAARGGGGGGGGPRPRPVAPPSTVPRGRNPITGDRESELSYKEPPPRDRNPIIHGEEEGFDHDPFADRKGYEALRRPRSAGSVRSDATNGTRPSADTLSLLHSPRSQASTNDNIRRLGGGLRQEQLDRFTRQQQQQPATASKRPGTAGPGIKPSNINPLDARALASKALDVGDIIKKVRDKIIERGGATGIRSLQRLLAIMDDNGDKRLSKDELRLFITN